MNTEVIVEEHGFIKDDGTFTIIGNSNAPYGFTGMDVLAGVFDEDHSAMKDEDLVALIRDRCLPEIQSIDFSTHGGVSLTAILNAHVNEIISELQDRKYLAILFQQEEGSEYVIFLHELSGAVDYSCSASVDSMIVNIVFNLPPTEMFVRSGLL